MELTRNIEKFKPKYFMRTPEMVVNVEWPGFFFEVLPLLEEDRQLDGESYKPGDQKFEKLTAGLYMGDIARRILHRYASSCRNGLCREATDVPLLIGTIICIGPRY